MSLGLQNYPRMLRLRFEMVWLLFLKMLFCITAGNWPTKLHELGCEIEWICNSIPALFFSRVSAFIGRRFCYGLQGVVGIALLNQLVIVCARCFSLFCDKHWILFWVVVFFFFVRSNNYSRCFLGFIVKIWCHGGRFVCFLRNYRRPWFWSHPNR